MIHLKIVIEIPLVVNEDISSLSLFQSGTNSFACFKKKKGLPMVLSGINEIVVINIPVGT